MDNDALSQAQAHCKELQSEYRRLVTEQTAIKTEEYKCSKEYARLVEERSRWEGQLATLQVLNEQSAACASLRQQLVHKDYRERAGMREKDQSPSLTQSPSLMGIPAPTELRRLRRSSFPARTRHLTPRESGKDSVQNCLCTSSRKTLA